MPFRELFDFKPGVPQKEEFDRLMDVLATELDWKKPIAILMHPFDDFDQELIHSVNPLDSKRTSHGEGVIAYQDGKTLRKNAWELFRLAEPMFVFNFSGQFQPFMEELDTVYPTTKSESNQFEESRFVRRFGPVVDLLPNPGRIYFSETDPVDA
jgi:hypothetical protein